MDPACRTDCVRGGRADSQRHPRGFIRAEVAPQAAIVATGGLSGAQTTATSGWKAKSMWCRMAM